MNYYAVIDTNVLLSALLSKHEDAATVKVMNAVLDGTIIPLFHMDMIMEYEDVLCRPKFCLQPETVQYMLKAFIQFGIEVFPQPTGEILIDMDDLIFYEVALDKRADNAYLVTGNQKHYPLKDFVVTPSEMMRIIENDN